MPYIYKITNLINQKAYIGKTTAIDPQERWREHKYSRNNARCKDRALYRALNKYGVENFNFEVIAEVANEDLNSEEQKYIQLFNTYHSGYNETLGGDGSTYLNLPEQEICKDYLQSHSVQAIADKYGHDRDTIKKVLYKYNIPIKSSSESIKLQFSKPVAQIDIKTNEILKIYPSVKEAERQVNANKHINAVCQGKRKTAGGYKWKYISDLEQEQIDKYYDG